MNKLLMLTVSLLFAEFATEFAAAKSSPDSHPRSHWGLIATQALNAQQALSNDLRQTQSRRRSKKKIIVAVIDTGIDQNHPMLADHLWLNPGESGLDSQGRDKSNNGIDDDHNGFVDDVQGWNFVAHSSQLADQHGHGTHISGLIASLAPEAKIMTLKYYDAEKTPQNNIDPTVAAIRYAVQMKVDVINFSGGGAGQSLSEKLAIKDAEQAGILVVAAAGNNGKNSDVEGYYPADYGLSNIISVGSLDLGLAPLPSSNYGRTSVDIAAPGADIVSSLPGNSMGAMTGTSQATAFVTGTAALLLSQAARRPSPQQLKARILASAQYDPRLRSKNKISSRLNTYHAIIMKDDSTSALGESLDENRNNNLGF